MTPTLIGSRSCGATLRLREFLTRNGVRFRYQERKEAGPDLPALRYNGTTLRKPSLAEVADRLALNKITDLARTYDLAIVGAGPAGLSCAIYAASGGLDTAVVESDVVGGQAGASSRIENYLGFPDGVAGLALTNGAHRQAEKFGARFIHARAAVGLTDAGHHYTIKLAPAGQVRARSVVIATGVQYRKLDVPNLARYEGVGVYYGATAMEATYCNGEDAIVVGGGNSAGQAAVFLSGVCSRLTLLARGKGLADGMSRYLTERIAALPNVTVRTQSTVTALAGDKRLERVTWQGPNGQRTEPVGHLFVMTGGTPRADWLDGRVQVDGKGFLLTGPAVNRFPLKRAPLAFEPSMPRVFAIGDIRSGSAKAIAVAVGEGSVCAGLVRGALAEVTT